ncbi:MAG: hypothetical protein ACK5B9_09920 [Flavobacteriia bacterium]|jgi:hypothetical protein
MKKTLLTILGAMGFVLSATATVRTVNNGTISAGQYTTVQEAVDASAAGDTVYIHGSVTSYGDVTLNKRIVLIGAGHKPTGTQYNLPTTLNTIILSRGNSTTLPTGSIIKGISFNNVYGSGGSLPVNNITFERNYIPSYISLCGDNWIIKNNFVGYVDCSNFNNLIVSNNIIGTQYAINSSNKPSVIITNNVFLNGFYLSNVSYSNFTNNIIIEPNALTNFSGTQNTYNKNIFIYADPLNFKAFPPAGNTGVGNLNTTSNQFVSTIPLNVNLDQARNYDWHLLSSSLGLGYGTDGTDCGIYGGSYPMPNTTGVTTIPQMVSMDIQNSVIPVNGTLDVEIKSRNQK